MHSHRTWVAITVGWLFLLFNIERIHEPINLASFVYALAACDGAAMLLSRRLRRAPAAASLVALLGVYVVVKCLLRYEISMASLPLAAAEVMGLAITHLLTIHIGRNTDEFAECTQQLVEALHGRETPSLAQAESQMLAEIRRARRHGRPLSFISLTPGDARSEDFEQLLRRLKSMLGREYVLGCVGELLFRETKSHDIVARVGSQFLMLLPETDSAQAGRLADRLRLTCRTRLGVAAATRVVPFPDEELTLTGVLDRLASTPPSTDPPLGKHGATDEPADGVEADCCLAE